MSTEQEREKVFVVWHQYDQWDDPAFKGVFGSWLSAQQYTLKQQSPWAYIIEEREIEP